MMKRTLVLAASACAFGLALGTAHAEPVSLDHGGLTLNGNLERADGSDLADGVVLLVHGTLAHHGMEIIADLQRNLAERDLNTLAVSLSYGQDDRTGMMDCGGVHTHRHEDAVAEIAAWVDWLEARGAGSVSVFGHSRGANQVAWFATHDAAAARIEKWVLATPSTWTEDGAAASYTARFSAPVEALVEDARARVAAGQGDQVMDVPGFIYCQPAQATAAAFASYHGPDTRFDTPTLLPDMSGPVLVIIAADDEIVTDLPERLADMPPRDDVEIETIPDAGHMFLDFAGLDLADAVAAFITR